MPEAVQGVPDNITAFREGTKVLALEGGFPVVTPAGTFVPDARAAWLVEATERWLVETQEPRIREGWFSASSLGKSDEELIAEYRGEVGEAHTAQTLRVFDLGHDRDRSLKRYLRGAKVSTLSEGDDEKRKMRVNWLHLQGECDDIVIDAAGVLHVFEFKTKSPYLYARLEEPDPAHYLQVHAYMGGLGIAQAIVLYECKGTQRWKAFYVPFDDGTWDGIVTRLQRLRAIAEEQPIESK